MKCKHNIGWCSDKQQTLFVIDKTLRIGFSYPNSKKYKVLFVCNNPDCKARRNIYLHGKVVTLGKIHYAKDKQKGTDGGKDVRD